MLLCKSFVLRGRFPLMSICHIIIGVGDLAVISLKRPAYRSNSKQFGRLLDLCKPFVFSLEIKQTFAYY